MRVFTFLNLGILAVLIASSAVLYAQDEKQQENKPRQEEPKRQEEPSRQARPESKQDEMKPPRQEEARPARQEQQERRQGEKPSREETRPSQQEPSRQEGGRQEAGRQQAGQPQAHARPAGKSGHIPDERFRAQFGRSHTFRAQRPVVVEGEPRFGYGGYSFVLVDPWPDDWAYTDDCYIDYVDGDYFLYDLLHPGMRIALFVVM